MCPNCRDPIAKRKDKKLFPNTVKVEAAVFHGHRCLGRTATSVKVDCEPLELDELMLAEVDAKETRASFSSGKRSQTCDRRQH